MATCYYCGYTKTPEGKTSCYNCGKKVGEPGPLSPKKPNSDLVQTPETASWEYDDFVMTWAKWSPSYLISGQDATYNEPQVRLDLWQMTQNHIRKELQSWLDNGWEPVTELGPAGFVLRTYTSRTKGLGFAGWMFIWLIPSPYLWADLKEFRLKMKRRKSPGPSLDQSRFDAAPVDAGLVEKLSQLKQAHEAGLISDDEWATKRDNLISSL